MPESVFSSSDAVNSLSSLTPSAELIAVAVFFDTLLPFATDVKLCSDMPPFLAIFSKVCFFSL
ncbi:MAG: hypothetical protein IJ025_00025 [Clostridia bacterium]|nr:hypothetical protein [Clostridia bacterium]